MKKIYLLLDNNDIVKGLTGAEGSTLDLPDTPIMFTTISKKLLEDASICDVANTEIALESGISSIVGLASAKYTPEEYEDFIKAIELMTNLCKLRNRPIQLDTPIINTYEKIKELLGDRVKIMQKDETN